MRVGTHPFHQLSLKSGPLKPGLTWLQQMKEARLKGPLISRAFCFCVYVIPQRNLGQHHNKTVVFFWCLLGPIGGSIGVQLDLMGNQSPLA